MTNALRAGSSMDIDNMSADKRVSRATVGISGITIRRASGAGHVSRSATRYAGPSGPVAVSTATYLNEHAGHLAHADRLPAPEQVARDQLRGDEDPAGLAAAHLEHARLRRAS